VKIVIVGDVHGHINLMYQKMSSLNIDMIIQLGDFLPVRDEADLPYVPVPTKYKKAGDFPEYFVGKRRTPIPTFFISGNHEPFNFIDGKFSKICDNVWCLGAYGIKSIAEFTEIAGIKDININNNINVAWLSGIYSEKYFDAAALETVTEENKRQASYIRAENFYELATMLEKRNADILLMHQPTAKFERYLVKNSGLREKDVDFLMGDILLEQCRTIKTVITGHTHVYATTQIGNTTHTALADIQSEQTCYTILDI